MFSEIPARDTMQLHSIGQRKEKSAALALKLDAPRRKHERLQEHGRSERNSCHCQHVREVVGKVHYYRDPGIHPYIPPLKGPNYWVLGLFGNAS